MERQVSFLAASVFFVSFGFGQTPSEPAKGCRDAQVLYVQGKWIADPGHRVLQKWDCLTEGDEVGQAEDEDTGKITVIYHRGAKPPFTQECKTHCRNGFKVEQV